MIVDTNVIVYCAVRKIDLLAAVRAMHEHYQPVLLDCIMEEIRHIGISETERNIALKLAERFENLDSSGFGDDCIINFATEKKAAVLSNDLNLRRILKAAGIRTYSLRQGKMIE